MLSEAFADPEKLRVERRNMRLTDVFDSEAVALNRSEVESNRIPFMGEAFFPNRKKVGLSIKWLKQNIGLNSMLNTSNFDAIPMIRTREGFKMENTEMVFFRESMHVKEEDMMEIMRAQDANDPYVDAVLDSIYDDANRLIDAADIAAENMRMQLLATNKGTPMISIGTSDNMIHTYNYDPDGTYKSKHYMELSGADTWDKPTTAKPFSDIREATKYLRSLGREPMYAVMTSKTFDYLLENDQVKAALVTLMGTPVTYLDDATAQNVFRQKTGLTPLLYDKMYIDYSGAEKNFYPDDQVTIIGSGQLGNTWYGTTPEERTLMGDSAADVSVLDRGVAIAVKTEAGPPVKVLTSVSQLVIPSYEGMNSTYVINVKGD